SMHLTFIRDTRCDNTPLTEQFYLAHRLILFCVQCALYSSHTLAGRGRKGSSMRHRADLLQSRRSRRFLLLTCSILSFSTVCAAASGAIRSGNSVDSTPTLVVQAQPATPRPAESQPTAPAQPSLRILPIHQAKFLAAARIDFRIEANHVSARPTAGEVAVAGK